MPKAGLFAGEITQAAPAGGALTAKPKGFQWMQYEIAPIPRTEVWVLNRGETGMFYTSVDYNTGVSVEIGTKAFALNFDESGFSCDGTYVLVVGDTAFDLAVLDWDGAVFTEIHHVAGIDTNGLDGLFGLPNNWICSGSGDFGGGVSTGTWTAGAISSAVTTRWTDDLSAWVLDFRSNAGGLASYSGYGDMFVAGKFQASVSEQIASFTLNDNGATAPTIIDTLYVATDTGRWGWDRDTGEFCNIDSGTLKIRYYNLDLSNGDIVFHGTIDLVVQSATFYKNHLITIDSTRIARSYTLSGLVPTLVDSIDFTTYISDILLARIHTDPFSDYIHFTKSNVGAVAVEFLDNGTFNPTVVNMYTATTDWTDSVNGIYFLDSALTVTP